MYSLNLLLRYSWTSGTLLGLFSAGSTLLGAQVPQVPQGQNLPTAEQARRALQNQPELVTQLRQRLLQSGLTPDQVRARLRAAGYPENMLDQYLTGADTTRAVRPGQRDLEAVSALGLLSVAELDSLEVKDSPMEVSDSLQ